MTRKRTGTPWMTADAYGKTLAGLSLNLIVRDVATSVPFYRDVLGFTLHYSDPDMAGAPARHDAGHAARGPHV